LIGKKLAHYEITALLGKGGMGEVYRARDAKLGRDVAVKVLPPAMSNNAERIARFEREARTLATLQHSNIASVYGFEEDAGVRFLVMELVEGEDLAARLARGRLPVDEAVVIAGQIAEGLEAAHERSIVHRDLKPANIKIDRDGNVKILDFGLARAYAGDSDSGEDIENSPTITAAMTQAGTILGTAAYMSPEQAKGKSIDKRADIWAFGAILYEMLSGKRLFQAETVSETLASVMLRDIAWDELPTDTPPSLRALMERCLQRDPKSRLRDIGEARIVLADPTASGALRIATALPPEQERARRRAWPWAVAVAAALVLGAAGGRFLGMKPAEPGLPPLTFDIPDNTRKTVTGSLALSPSGRHLVYARRDSLGGNDLWIRRLDEDESRLLQGTHDGKFPFWSADGKNIGFFVGNSVYRMSLDGGAATRIATLSMRPRGGAWNGRDVILAGTDGGPIFRVPAGGGAVEAATQVVDGEENAHCWPEFLPDGEHFVFLADASSDDGHRMYVYSLDGKEKKILEKAVRSAILVDPAGALLWCQDSQLFARPFDFSRREFTGTRVLVQGGIQPYGENHECAMTLSTNGVLAFQAGSDESVIVRAPLDGSAREVVLPPGRYRNPRLSPDGKMLAFELQGSSDEREIWVQDLARGTRALMSERGQLADSPAWSPDGGTLYYDANVAEHWQIFRKRVNGGAPPEMLGAPPGNDYGVLDCSLDGKWLLAAASMGAGRNELYLTSLEGDTLSWSPWLTGSTAYNFARFSPDSRWIAFQNGATGQIEVYVAPIEGGPSVQQLTVSVGGGRDPAWSRDGSTIYYMSLTGTLMESAITRNGDQIEFSPPSRTIELHPPMVGYLRNGYDPTPGGNSVIAFVETERYNPAIRVRTGWRTW